MQKTEKRVLWTLGVMLLLFAFCMAQLLQATLWRGTLAQTAATQQHLTLTFSAGRGTVYDRNMQALTGGRITYLTAVEPGRESAAALSRSLSKQQMQALYPQLKEGYPFFTYLPVRVKGEGVLSFPQQQRRPSHPLAPHLVGYLDGSGHGVCGAEKAFDKVLSSAASTTRITYTVDALRHPLPEEQPQVTSTAAGTSSSEVLTIDSGLQKLAETAAGTAFEKGAVVILKAGSGEILASASLPSFDPADLSKTVQQADGALVDRTLAPCSVGSVFKIAAAAAALENGLDPNAVYTCHGSETAGGFAFHCAGGESHGRITLQQALAQSCNSYFVSCMRKVPPTAFLQMARRLGFGQKTEIAPQLCGGAGTLPSLLELKNPRALANFSFGQGTLTASPMQVAAMVNAVASGGIYTRPSLSLGTANATGKIVVPAEKPAGTRAFTQRTADLIRDGMEMSAEKGTGRAGKPQYVKAAVKTATAQTGHYTAGKEDVVSWYAGFFPVDSPRYVVVIMEDGGSGGGVSCGPIFRRIADTLYPKD